MDVTGELRMQQLLHFSRCGALFATGMRSLHHAKQRRMEVGFSMFHAHNRRIAKFVNRPAAHYWRGVRGKCRATKQRQVNFRILSTKLVDNSVGSRR